MLLADRLQTYLQYNLRTFHHHTAIPLDCFTLYVHPTDSSFDANMAFPTPAVRELADLKAAIHRTCAVSLQHGRAPHLQFLDQAAPALQAYLDAQDFIRRHTSPVLIGTPELIPFPQPLPDTSIVVLDQAAPLATIREGLDVNALGFDPDAPRSSAEDARRFRQSLVTSRAFILRYAHQAVAGGMFNEIRAGITELVGIATRIPFRRRGFAQYLTAYMAHTAFQQGADVVFLIAANEAAARVYTHAGFQIYAERLSYEPRSAWYEKERPG